MSAHQLGAEVGVRLCAGTRDTKSARRPRSRTKMATGYIVGIHGSFGGVCLSPPCECGSIHRPKNTRARTRSCSCRELTAPCLLTAAPASRARHRTEAAMRPPEAPTHTHQEPLRMHMLLVFGYCSLASQNRVRTLPRAQCWRAAGSTRRRRRVCFVESSGVTRYP